MASWLAATAAGRLCHLYPVDVEIPTALYVDGLVDRETQIAHIAPDDTAGKLAQAAVVKQKHLCNGRYCAQAADVIEVRAKFR